ncbi:carbohydrate-binding domain-containing protein [Methylobacterium komagatae]
MSQDFYKDNAQFTVSVDGQQVGGILAAHATHSAGQSDTITLNGDWATGDHQVSINFLNDAYGGSASTDRNLYLDSATFNGFAVSGSQFAFMIGGVHTFAVHNLG